MKQLKLHWSAKPLSYLLSLAMVLPSLMVLLLASAPIAQAQDLTRTAQPSWAVLDFENHSGYGSDEVGRLTSDAFVLELGKSGKYNVTPRQDTVQGLQNLGLTLPLDVIGIQKFGRDRSVDAVATGEVAAVSFSNNPRQATVSVVIRVIDTTSGEMINGAISQGVSNPRTLNNTDDDALVNQAIDNAAFAAVKQITAFNLPKATILINNDANTVLINRGSRDGVYAGLDMVVSRNGTEVGRIRVSNVSSDQSDAIVTKRGLGIQPQDRATAIYALPSYNVKNNVLHAKSSDIANGGSDQGEKRNSFSGIGGILVAILAAALLLNLVRRGSNTDSIGGGQIGNAMAVENRTNDPYGTGIGGNGIPPGGSLLGGPTIVGNFDATVSGANWVPVAVKITASLGNIPNSQFIEYHVYRDDYPFANVVATNGGGGAGGSGGTTVTGLGTVQVPIFAQEGVGPLSFYDDGEGHVVSYRVPIPQNTGLEQITGSTTTSGTNNQPIWPQLGLQEVGRRYQYFIEGLYSQTVANSSAGTSGGGGTGTGTTTSTTAKEFFLTPKTPTNYITYIEPVIFNTGNQNTGAGQSFAGSTSSKNVIVAVPVTRGADDYVLQFSTNPGFTNIALQIRPSNTPNPYAPSALDPRQNMSQHTFVTFQTDLSKFGNPLFSRIGARDSRNGTNTRTNPYVYTDVVGVPSGLV